MDVLTLRPGYSTAHVAELSGLTFRQLDWLASRGALHPGRSGRGHGSGSRRVWTDSDLARACLAAALRDLGASTVIVAKVLVQLPAEPSDWPAYAFIEPDGTLHEFRPPGPAWWGVSLKRLLPQAA